MEQDLVRNILKSSNSTTFISCLPRVPKNKAGELPGPGSYNSDSLIYDEPQPSYVFKSGISRANKDIKCCLSSPSNVSSIKLSEKKNSPIHIKEDSIIEYDSIIQSPPFMSSSSRFA